MGLWEPVAIDRAAPSHCRPFGEVPGETKTISVGGGGSLQAGLQPPCTRRRATIDEVETDVVEIEAKLDKVREGPGGT